MRRACIASAVGLLAVLVLPPARAELPGGVAQRKTELQNLREEIKRQESMLSRRKKDEKAAIDYLAKLDREIDISHAYLHSLNGDVERLGRQMDERDGRISALKAEKEALADQVKKRLVSFYKHGRAQEIDLMLSIRSVQQALVWLRYQKMIADADRRNLLALAARRQELEKQQDYLRQEKADKARALREREAEERKLTSSREKRKSYLVSVRKDKKVLEQRLRDNRASEKQILALIAKAEQARLTASARKPAAAPGRVSRSTGPARR